VPSTTLDPRPGERPESADPAGLRERKKLETRTALTDAAYRLFADKGFEETTVEDIAEVVGVSPRTFHRYFARKDDVVFADGEVRLERFRARLHEAPAATVLGAVRHAAVEAVAEAGVHDRTRAELIAGSPALRAQNLERYDEWARIITEFAAAATDDEPGGRWPTVLGACVMAALTSARRRWLADAELDLRAEYDEVLGLLDGLDRPVADARRVGAGR
jgi:AcrR family transcriptional regulator